MKNLSSRVVVTAVSSVAAFGLVLTGATPATAASGNPGVGGGAVALALAGMILVRIRRHTAR